MDVFLLTAIVHEIAPLINGARINKIFQPESDAIVMRLWHGGANLRLLLSASPRFGHLALIDDNAPNPPSPPRFCQLLRARLSYIKELRQIPEERIVELVCGGTDDQEYRLVLELLGTRTNLLLCSTDGKIVDTLKRVDDSVGRALLPGQLYSLPEAVQRLSLSAKVPSPEELDSGRGDWRKYLMNTLSPMSPTVAGILADRATDFAHLFDLLMDLKNGLQQADFHPIAGIWKGKTVLVPFRFLSETLADTLSFATINEAVNHYYLSLQEDDGGVGLRRELQQLVHKTEAKLEKRQAQIRQELTALNQFDDLKVKGELLLANLFRIKPGDQQVVAENYYQSPSQQLAIPLDPTLTAQENAERYFSRYKKAKRGLSHVEERLAVTQQECDWIADIALGLEQAETAVDLEAIRQELQQAGFLRDSHYSPKGKARSLDAKERLRHRLSPGGFHLYWGRNNLTNDYVSKVLTSSDDLWFHSHNCPGCHLVLKRDTWKGEIPEEDILFAASLAAGYSHGKDDSKLEVMVVQGRHVNKPKGARPGLVTVQQFRTVMVRPTRGDD